MGDDWSAWTVRKLKGWRVGMGSAWTAYRSNWGWGVGLGRANTAFRTYFRPR